MVKKTKKKTADETVEDSNKADENIHQEDAAEGVDSSADSGQYEELRKKLLKEYEAQKGGDDQAEEAKVSEDKGHEEPTIVDEPSLDGEEQEIEEDVAPDEDEGMSSDHQEEDDSEEAIEEDEDLDEDEDMSSDHHEEDDSEEAIEEDEDIADDYHEEEDSDEEREIEEDVAPDEDEGMSSDHQEEDDDHHEELTEGEESFEYTSDKLEDDMSDVYNNTAPDVDQGQSSVAISSKKSLAMMVILALVVLFILYKVLKPEDSVDDESQIDKNSPITVPVADTGQAIVVPEIPDIPAVPKLSAPTPPPAPTPPMVSDLSVIQVPTAPIPVTSAVIKKDDPADAARRKARLSSGIMVGSDVGSTQNKNVTTSGKSLSILARNNDQVVATSIGDLRRVIAQGKVLDAVLETAINTDLPGAARAVISRDIYSESGKNILIPRGSRLLGNYSSTVSFGINRVKVTWSRLIRPDGIDIAIASPGIDQIGHAGVAGDMDNHIAKSMSIALMTSVIDVAAAIYADKQAEPTTVTSTVQPATGTVEAVNTDGTTSTTQASSTGSTVVSGTISNEQQAYMDAVDNIGSVGKGILAKTNEMKPTITIDQGAALKVFVNKDLVFPGKSANLTRVVE